jgi:hypothetical protein
MATNTVTSNILEEFNTCFKGTATAVIIGNQLQITIGNTTLVISLPEVIGEQSYPKD